MANNKIIIIGAGPAGLFAAYNLVNEFRNKIDITIIDKGHLPDERFCSALNGLCSNCRICALISGLGGAGLFSDGKLIFNLESGGHLKEILDNNKNEKQRLEIKIGKIIDKFSYNYVCKKPFYDNDSSLSFTKYNLQFNPYPVVHLGSKNIKQFALDIFNYLKENKVKFMFNTNVSNISSDTNEWKINIFKNDEKYNILTKYLIVAVGKESNFWFSSNIEKLGGISSENNTYIGIRMEMGEKSAEEFSKIALDPKLSLALGDDSKIKTHCFCKNGRILLLKYLNLPIVGGHSPYIRLDPEYNVNNLKNSNIAFLLKNKYCDRKKSLEIMNKINKETKGKLIVQRLGDYLDNIPSTNEKITNNKIKPSNINIVPGQISDNLIEGFRLVFIEFLDKLSFFIPDIKNPDNLLYAPAIEWWMKKISINNKMEVNNLYNIYAIGDGSGWTQGIIQSAATGILAAEDISNKIIKDQSLIFHSKIIQESQNENEKICLC